MLPKSIRAVLAVVGCQRSGTTLTGQMFGAAPNSFLVDENDSYYRWMVDPQARSGDVDEEARYLRDADEKYREARLESIPQSLVEGDGLSVQFRAGIDTLVLKAPNLTTQPHLLRLLGPLRVGVAYPVRDPRDAVASMVKQFRKPQVLPRQVALCSAELQRKFPAEVALMQSNELDHRRFAAMWVIKSSRHQDFYEAGLPTAGFRYEDLVADPASTLRRACGTVGLPSHPDMLRHGEVLEGRAPGQTERDRPVDTASVHRWKQALTEHEAADVWEITRSVAETFGYSAE